jgi:hypothetical protein
MTLDKSECFQRIVTGLGRSALQSCICRYTRHSELHMFFWNAPETCQAKGGTPVELKTG